MTRTTQARNRVLTAATLLLLAGVAGATPARSRLGHAHEADVVIAARRTAPRSSRGGTVQVTNDRFLGHVEPDVATNPRNSANLLGASQYETTSRQRLPGTFASFDGGRSWQDNGLLPRPRGYEQGADTTVGFARDGTGYVAALMSHGGNGFASRVTRGGIFLWQTRNGGRSFSAPIPVYVGRGFQDHPWLAIRNTRRGAVLFLAWTNRAGLDFARSLPASTTFSQPRVLVPGSSPSTPVLVTGPGRRLDVFFQESSTPSTGAKRQPLPTRLAVVGSNNDGETFDPPQTIAKVTIAPGPGEQQPAPLLAAAADPSTPVAAVAIAAQDSQRGHPVIELWRRPSPGGHWLGPSLPANGAVASLTQEQPRLAFANGQLYVSYFTISRAGRIREQLAHAPERSGAFTAQQLAGRAFTATGFIGDYQTLALTTRFGYALWNSNESTHLEIVAARFPLTR